MRISKRSRISKPTRRFPSSQSKVTPCKAIRKPAASKLSYGKLSNRALFVHYYNCGYLYFLAYRKRVSSPFNVHSSLTRSAGYIYHEIMEMKFRGKWNWQDTFAYALKRSNFTQVVKAMATRDQGVYPSWAQEKIRERVMFGLEKTRTSQYKHYLESLTNVETEATRDLLGAHFYIRVDGVGLFDNQRFILDYKLSKSSSHKDNNQLLYYSFLIPAQFGLFYYVMDDTMIKVDFTKEVRRRTLKAIMQIVDGINREKWLPNRKYCSKCYLRDVCDKRE